MAHFTMYVNSFNSSSTHYNFTIAQSFNTTYLLCLYYTYLFKERLQRFNPDCLIQIYGEKPIRVKGKMKINSK